MPRHESILPGVTICQECGYEIDVPKGVEVEVCAPCYEVMLASHVPPREGQEGESGLSD